MILRKCFIGAATVLVALAPVACSTDTNTDSAASATSTPQPAAPAAAQLQGSLSLLVDPAKTAAEKVVTVVNGNARTANYQAMTAALVHYPVTFKVSDVVVHGHNADAQVLVTSPHGSMTMPMTWAYTDGSWKLSDASSCQLLGMGQAPCQ